MRAIICLLIIIMLKRLGILKMAGFTSPKHWQYHCIGWPVVILIMLNSIDIFTGKSIIDTSNPILFGTYMLDSFSIGFFEEVLVRGFILIVLLVKWGNTRQGIYFSVISCSIVFGLAHIINLIKDPNLVIATFAQIIYATFFGVIFAALVLRNRTIWLAIFLHSLFDFCGNIKEISVGDGIARSVMDKASTSLSSALVAVVISLPLFFYGLFILRKVTPQSLFKIPKFDHAHNKGEAL